MFKFLAINILIILQGCSDGKTDVPEEFFYDLSAPSEIFELPDELEEISGLHLIDENNIACINDEDGELFIFNLSSGKIKSSFKFGKDNDYEGVTFVNNNVFVLESDGDLHFIENYLEENESEKIGTDLKSRCDAEGICYDKKNNRLLIVCKGKAEKKDKDKKAVYAFNLEKEKLKNDPVFTVDLDKIEDKIITNWLEDFSLELRKAFDFDGSGEIFNPSGIAIHPSTTEIYIISSKYKILVVLSEDGDLKNIVPMNHPRFHQPEGITFDYAGNLFISNEGTGGKPNILKFELINK